MGYNFGFNIGLGTVSSNTFQLIFSCTNDYLM